MPEESVTGIVLRRKDSGESDRRLTLLTKEHGKIDVVAKGARKAASRLSGSTEPFCTAVFSLATRVGSNQKRNAFLTQSQPLSGFRGLRADYDRLCFGLALVELFAAVLPYEEPSDEVYDLLFIALHALESHPKPEIASVWAQIWLLRLSGFLPQFEMCVVCDAPSRLAEGAVSPAAGGFVCPNHERDYSDRFLTRHEVLIALDRLSSRPAPPENLKFANPCLITLTSFWRHIADTQLPAMDALIKHLHSERLSEE